MTETAEGTLLWEPSPGFPRERYHHPLHGMAREGEGPPVRRLHRALGVVRDGHRGFWASLWEFFDIQSSKPYQAVLARREMPGAEWFPGAELNYAEHVFRNSHEEGPALVHASESASVGGDELGGAGAEGRRLSRRPLGDGGGRGDRVVAYLPNVPEAVVAFLACASLGAVWSSASPTSGLGAWWTGSPRSNPRSSSPATATATAARISTGPTS